MKCARCPAEATLESGLPGPAGAGLVTEWICYGCACEKMGLPRDWKPPEPKKKRKPRVAPAEAAQRTLFE